MFNELILALQVVFTTIKLSFYMKIAVEIKNKVRILQNKRNFQLNIDNIYLSFR